MGRKARIIGQVIDAFGDAWDIREERPTSHGFSVYLGWPQAVPRGQGGGGPRTIITRELAAYLESHRHNFKDIDLPLGKTAIKRLRRVLGHHYRQDRALWWEERFKDLISMTVEDFSLKHGVSQGAVSQWRKTLIGPWFCKIDQETSMKHIQKALQEPTCVAADILGISAPQVRRLRARANIAYDEEKMIKVRELRKKEAAVAGEPEEPRQGLKNWSPWELSLLGEKPDDEVAKLIGISLSAVSKKRQQLDIGPYKKEQE